MPARKLLSEKIADELERIEDKLDNIEPARVQKTISSAVKNLTEIKDRIAELEDLGAIKNKRRKSDDGKAVVLSDYQKFVKKTFPIVKSQNSGLEFTQISKIVSEMWQKTKIKKSAPKKGKKGSDSDDSGSEFSDADDDDDIVKPKKKAPPKKVVKKAVKKGGYYDYEYF